MKYILTINFCLLILNLSGQETELIIKKDRLRKQFFKYEVLKDNQIIKDGKYTEYYYPLFGLSMFAKYVKIEGSYFRNLRDEIWTLYSNTGEKHMQVDYSNYKILYKSPIILEDEQTNNSYTNVDLSFGRQNGAPPDFETGFKYFYEYVAKNINRGLCPQDSTEIRVYIKFLIKEDKTLDNIEITESAGDEYDKEALRLISNTNGMWEPGYNPKNKRIEAGVIFKKYE